MIRLLLASSNPGKKTSQIFLYLDSDLDFRPGNAADFDSASKLWGRRLLTVPDALTLVAATTTGTVSEE